MASQDIVKLDLREIPIFERHPRIFETWDSIEPEQTLQLINDHDPKPLHYQFEAEYKGAYSWQYLSEGPVDWVVNITKVRGEEAPFEDIKRRVNEALENIRPFLQADGGDIELVDIDNDSKVVKVRLQGACGGCPSSHMTLKAGVEKRVKDLAPEIKRVEAV